MAFFYNDTYTDSKSILVSSGKIAELVGCNPADVVFDIKRLLIYLDIVKI